MASLKDLTKSAELARGIALQIPTKLKRLIPGHGQLRMDLFKPAQHFFPVTMHFVSATGTEVIPNLRGPFNYGRTTVSRQPDTETEAQALRYAYTVLMSAVTPSLQYLVRCVPYGNVIAAYQALQEFFVINDNTSRWRMRGSFNTLTMEPDEDFLSFCGKIQHMASQINALENKQVIGDSEMTLCLTNGVLRHHNDTFYNILKGNFATINGLGLSRQKGLHSIDDNVPLATVLDHISQSVMVWNDTPSTKRFQRAGSSSSL
eukprot:CAMPEP_0175155324 /NCGR_PEP_ID=MMETSP0087-20121206/20905_1 /TAXON_ID=136419 /ORGANISM="Unknown Unknown, Strain D1" /LENGTH=260 /DNA_ID=CAMNT_0016442453 /DNA_START=660 /DNA_END=1439 /DNA_ORIENTATION=-